MLRFNTDLINLAITDISTGRPLGSTASFVIDPDNLTIMAFACNVRVKDKQLYLLASDIHSFSGATISIQDEVQLSPLDDLIKVKDLKQINYQPVGKKVKTDLGRKVGAVTQYAVDDRSFSIEKIYIRPPVTRILASSDVIIDRAQITEVNDREIIVRDASVRRNKFVEAGADA